MDYTPCYHSTDAFCDAHCDCACETCCLERLVSAGKACMICHCTEDLDPSTMKALRADTVLSHDSSPAVWPVGPRDSVACRQPYADAWTLKAGSSHTTYILCTDCLTLQERQEFRGCKGCWEDVCRCDFEEEGPEEDDREPPTPCDCGACEEHDGREEGWE